MINFARPWSVHTGDCRSILADMDPESVDAVVTDTPYGLSTLLDPPNLDREALWRKLTAGLSVAPIVHLLRSWLDTGENPVMRGRGFMGKEWDALVPPPNTWRAVWRVMKPGAYSFAFGGTRTDDLIKMSMRLADFELEDTFSYLFGSGMPKRVRLDLKIDEHFDMKDARPVLGMRNRILNRTPTENWVKSMEPQSRGTNGHCSGGSGAFTPIDGAATPEAARFVGWDRASKPGWEPIIIACKPLRGTIAETALRYGTGGMNADGCRIPRQDVGIRSDGATRGRKGQDRLYASLGNADCEPIAIDPRGGFPANVIIDEEVAAELDRLTGPCGGAAPASGPTINGAYEGSAAYGARGGIPAERVAFHGRVEGASSFFYTAKASTSERDKGLEDLPVLTPGQRSGGREEGSAGINAYAGTRGEKGRNPGPCVKPISLMRYLVRRASPPGAWDPDPAKRPLVLDCFMGSGSTGVACMVEGVRFIGSEMDPEMAEVARLRLQHAYSLPREEAEDAAPATRAGGQVKLF